MRMVLRLVRQAVWGVIVLAVLLGALGFFSVGVAFVAPITSSPWTMALQAVLMVAGAATGIFVGRERRS